MHHFWKKVAEKHNIHFFCRILLSVTKQHANFKFMSTNDVSNSSYCSGSPFSSCCSVVTLYMLLVLADFK